jgi:two-component system, chemotaxis family, sensor histidine kinase and response regulator PixL
MDNDKQIPIKFLDESEDCCDRMESTILGFGNKVPNPQELDEALRAAHSIKGGAAMMGFMPLSLVAHHLEDYFKILRVRYHAKSINTEVETLLLQGVDCLRQVSNLHRQGQLVDEAWLTSQSQPVFDRLREHLGDLRPEDEDALLSQEGDVDPAILLFESGVKEALDHLDSKFEILSSAQLLQELQMTAEELGDFGRMAKLDRFVDLCQSVTGQSQLVDATQVEPLTRQALKVWRKSHAVVLLGRFEKIPTQIPGLLLAEPADIPNSFSDFSAFVTDDQDFFNPDLTGLEGLVDLSLFQSEIENIDLQMEQEFSAGFNAIPVFDQVQPSSALFSELAAFESPDFADSFNPNWDSDESPADFGDLLLPTEAPLELLSELANIELPTLFSEISFADDDQLAVVVSEELVETEQSVEAVAITVSSTEAPSTVVNAVNRQTVRVPVEYLQQFNTVFGQLILERNAINLRLKEIQDYTGLLRKRMKHLEVSNQELREWYDYSPGTISNSSAYAFSDRTSTVELDSTAANQQPGTIATASKTTSLAGFDLLEMDRYSDLHLVSQNQIETIVQLQEVTADIELSLQEMTQSVRSLNQTTRTLQSNVTRTQMLPFADVVKRFPRLIRDLSVQFGKSVNLQISGENTGIDRAILENLSDPLMHLLRNAFDHGIEDPATRMAAGKPAQGTILLEASYRSGETVITISDDGGGIRLDRIRDRLEKMGFPTAEVAKMPESELLDTIFEPGFSTATSLTELSGRGVGMDVVRTNIEQIRGDIRVKTQPGVGTKFIIRVPFTLSIVRVMLLERAGFVFAASVDSVQEIIRWQPDLLTADGTKISWQSQVIPLVALEQGISFGRNRRPFELPGKPTIDQPTILIVGEDSSSMAFSIDRFWGEQEVTLRSIDCPMPLTPGFGNSILLGDGRVVPLVDLIQYAEWMSVQPATSGNIATDSSARTSGDQMIGANYTPVNTILVIDDSINVRRYLAVMLEKEGYQVEEAKDGQEAVDKLFGGLLVQAAICDMEMPRLDGYGVLEALRAAEAFENLPIVMLTSRNSEKHRMLAMNLGASDYFTKPYTEPELLGSLKSLIEKSSQNLLAISR